MGVKLDKIHYSNLHESYRNYKTDTAQFTISGSVPPGGQQFTTTISFARQNTRADIYIQKVGNNFKRHANSIARLTEYSGATSAYVIIKYTSSSVQVGALVVNFGGSPITATTETYNVTVVQYDAPISL